MMPAFGPGIGKEHIYSAELGLGGQRGQEIVGFRSDKVHVPQPRPLAFLLGPLDAVLADIDSHADFVWMSLGIGVQEVPVAAADFENEGPAPADRSRAMTGFSAFPTGGDLIGDASIQASGPAFPLPASIKTIRMLMSAGLTPLIRLACPRVKGRISVSLSALSRRRPRTAR